MFAVRPCLKNGNMPKGEGFFRLARGFDAEILTDFCVKTPPSKRKKTRHLDVLTIFKQGLKAPEFYFYCICALLPI